MKNCPNGCGMFDDYETKCPACGAKLVKLKGNTNTQTQTAANNTSSARQVSGNNQNSGGYHFGTSSGSAGGQGGMGNQPRFTYDTHIYGQRQTSPSNNNPQFVRQNSSAGKTAPVQQSCNIIPGNGNQIRGRVKNFREDFLPMNQMGNLLYSAVHGANVTRDEEVTNFQLIEYDQNDNQTGRVYSVILRGKVIAGHFYEGNTVIVEGRQGRGGEIHAKNIFNESANCFVRYRRHKRVL